MQEVLLESCRDGGLARGREAGEPDGETTLAAELVALLARQGRVPGDVSGGRETLVQSTGFAQWLKNTKMVSSMVCWGGVFSEEG